MTRRRRRAHRAAPVPLLRFRLYPEHGRSLFCTVNVWATRADYVAHMLAVGARAPHRDGASVSSFTRQRFNGTRWRTLPEFAEMNLMRARLGTEVITHEMLHVAIAYGRRVRFDFRRLDASDSVNADEERLCYVHGRLCREFVNRAHDAGLYD